jgi:hypothetical protein
LAILSALALAGSHGCGGPEDNLPREPVSGKVSFEGQPVVKGNIQFIPAGSQATQVGAMIKDGSYSIERAEGPVPGTYKVTINAPDPTGQRVRPASSDTGAEAPGDGKRAFAIPKDLIPRKYNVDSTLAVEVKAGAANTFDFDLKK